MYRAVVCRHNVCLSDQGIRPTGSSKVLHKGQSWLTVAILEFACKARAGSTIVKPNTTGSGSTALEEDGAE
jgi:hypothetical protein